MTLVNAAWRWATLILFCACWSGCSPLGESGRDEEKDPNYLTGKNRMAALDHQGAIDAFEKALTDKPRSGHCLESHQFTWLAAGGLGPGRVEPGRSIRAGRRASRLARSVSRHRAGVGHDENARRQKRRVALLHCPQLWDQSRRPVERQ